MGELVAELVPSVAHQVDRLPGHGGVVIVDRGDARGEPSRPQGRSSGGGVIQPPVEHACRRGGVVEWRLYDLHEQLLCVVAGQRE